MNDMRKRCFFEDAKQIAHYYVDMAASGDKNKLGTAYIEKLEQISTLTQQLKECREALKEIAEWPRNPEGPNYSIKYIAKLALKGITNDRS